MAKKPKTYSPNLQAALAPKLGGHARFQPGQTEVDPNLGAALVAMGFLPKHQNTRGEYMLPGQTQGGSGLDNQTFRGLDEGAAMRAKGPGGGGLGMLPNDPNWHPAAPKPPGYDPMHPTVISRGTTMETPTYPGLPSQGYTPTSLLPNRGEQEAMDADRRAFGADPNAFRGLGVPRPPMPVAPAPTTPPASLTPAYDAIKPNDPFANVSPFPMQPQPQTPPFDVTQVVPQIPGLPPPPQRPPLVPQAPWTPPPPAPSTLTPMPGEYPAGQQSPPIPALAGEVPPWMPSPAPPAPAPPPMPAAPRPYTGSPFAQNNMQPPPSMEGNRGGNAQMPVMFGGSKLFDIGFGGPTGPRYAPPIQPEIRTPEDIEIFGDDVNTPLRKHPAIRWLYPTVKKILGR